MHTNTKAIVEAHWNSANARDWATFGRLLDPALQYEVPQTREYIEGAEGYLDMFSTWPGDWKAQIKTLVCEGERAASIIDFIVDDSVMTGITVFAFSCGRITSVTDYWPDSYEPPPRQSAHMKRRKRET